MGEKGRPAAAERGRLSGRAMMEGPKNPQWHPRSHEPRNSIFQWGYLGPTCRPWAFRARDEGNCPRGGLSCAGSRPATWAPPRGGVSGLCSLAGSPLTLWDLICRECDLLHGPREHTEDPRAGSSHTCLMGHGAKGRSRGQSWVPHTSEMQWAQLHTTAIKQASQYRESHAILVSRHI